MQHEPPMIQLTEQQHEAMGQQADQPIRAIDPATREEYVLLPADVFERLKRMLGPDEGWAAEGYEAAMEVFAREGWDDPRMDVYDAPQTATPEP